MRLRALFDVAPLPLVDMDCSAVLDPQQLAGRTDAEDAASIHTGVRFLGCSTATNRLFEANDPGRTFDCLRDLLSQPQAIQALQALASGQEVTEPIEIRTVTLAGEPLDVAVRLATASGQGDPLRHVVMSLEDVTSRNKTVHDLYTYQQQLEAMVAQRNTELLSVNSRLTASAEMIGALMTLRDPYTVGHMQRVAHIAVDMASQLGCQQRFIENVEIAALLHDVGKVAVPSEVFSKVGDLTDAEMGLIRDHAQIGHDLLLAVDFDSQIAQMVLQHHERIDGSGYPKGLRSSQIGLGGRILGLADTIDSMGSDRPARPALPHGRMVAEVRRAAGKLFDVTLCEFALAILEQRARTRMGTRGVRRR